LLFASKVPTLSFKSPIYSDPSYRGYDTPRFTHSWNFVFKSNKMPVCVIFSFPPPFVPEENSISWLYDELDEHWRRWLPAGVSHTVRRGAFYSVLVRPGFRILSVNMNYCNNKNWWLLINSTDPVSELQWLVYELQGAEINGEKVHIIGHIPPGHSDCLKVWSRNYYHIVNRFVCTNCPIDRCNWPVLTSAVKTASSFHIGLTRIPSLFIAMNQRSRPNSSDTRITTSSRYSMTRRTLVELSALLTSDLQSRLTTILIPAIGYTTSMGITQRPREWVNDGRVVRRRGQLFSLD